MLSCTQHNSLTAGPSSIRFCVNMFLDNRTEPREFQGHRSKVKVTGTDYPIFNRDRAKKFAGTITHEPLHSAWGRKYVLSCWCQCHHPCNMIGFIAKYLEHYLVSSEMFTFRLTSMCCF